VAPYDAPVLIFGETDTDKERVASAVHRLSCRHAARFEAVNGGALTREFLRSELFGHERGASRYVVALDPGSSSSSSRRPPTRPGRRTRCRVRVQAARRYTIPRTSGSERPSNLPDETAKIWFRRNGPTMSGKNVRIIGPCLSGRREEPGADGGVARE
jgi:hypothetical protein